MEGRACRPDKCDGGWRLRETIAVKAGDFGRSSAFCGDVDQAKGAFTLTMRNPPVPAPHPGLAGLRPADVRRRAAPRPRRPEDGHGAHKAALA
ncbi:hypothetical protein EASAB2608_00108 [Streptomyces sp. EAS-AB2608]|nr:hypothetical protein EASAB2608_00108 [Streptomyces sp. EAS-AB2608]